MLDEQSSTKLVYNLNLKKVTSLHACWTQTTDKFWNLKKSKKQKRNLEQTRLSSDKEKDGLITRAIFVGEI